MRNNKKKFSKFHVKFKKMQFFLDIRNFAKNLKALLRKELKILQHLLLFLIYLEVSSSDIADTKFNVHSSQVFVICDIAPRCFTKLLPKVYITLSCTAKSQI